MSVHKDHIKQQKLFPLRKGCVRCSECTSKVEILLRRYLHVELHCAPAWIVAVSFIGIGNQSICQKSLQGNLVSCGFHSILQYNIWIYFPSYNFDLYM
jgi:hypothetical protein